MATERASFLATKFTNMSKLAAYVARLSGKYIGNIFKA